MLKLVPLTMSMRTVPIKINYIKNPRNLLNPYRKLGEGYLSMIKIKDFKQFHELNANQTIFTTATLNIFYRNKLMSHASYSLRKCPINSYKTAELQKKLNALNSKIA